MEQYSQRPAFGNSWEMCNRAIESAQAIEAQLDMAKAFRNDLAHRDNLNLKD